MTSPAVFPCRGKRPLTRHGFKDATTNPAVIARWEREYPGCWWGAAIPEGMFVLDVDAHHDGPASLERLTADHGPLPETRTSRTPRGGWHYWWTTDKAGELRQTQVSEVLGQGLDTRVCGRGYVMVPPSPGYRWENTGPVAQAPTWMVALLRQAPAVATRAVAIRLAQSDRYVDAAVRSECERVANCPVGIGERNATLYKAAVKLGTLIGAGRLDKHVAGRSLLAATSLPEREATSTILSGLNWGASHPRQVAS